MNNTQRVPATSFSTALLTAGNYDSFLALVEPTPQSVNLYVHHMYASVSLLADQAHATFSDKNCRFDKRSVLESCSEILFNLAQITKLRGKLNIAKLEQKFADASEASIVDDAWIPGLRPDMNPKLHRSLAFLLLLIGQVRKLQPAAFASTSRSHHEVYRSDKFVDDLVVVYAYLVYFTRSQNIQMQELMFESLASRIALKPELLPTLDAFAVRVCELAD